MVEFEELRNHFDKQANGSQYFPSPHTYAGNHTKMLHNFCTCASQHIIGFCMHKIFQVVVGGANFNTRSSYISKLLQIVGFSTKSCIRF